MLEGEVDVEDGQIEVEGRVRGEAVVLPGAKASEHQSTNAVALRCEIMTPLGFPVDPDV